VENSLQNATVQDAQVPLDDRDEGFHFVASDLVSLIDRVQASIQLIETAQAQEDGADGELGDIIVLDDVTPLYPPSTPAMRG
jgi:prophage antirepressor-like protein